jgi:hypothetical protein
MAGEADQALAGLVAAASSIRPPVKTGGSRPLSVAVTHSLPEVYAALRVAPAPDIDDAADIAR